MPEMKFKKHPKNGECWVIGCDKHFPDEMIEISSKDVKLYGLTMCMKHYYEWVCPGGSR